MGILYDLVLIGHVMVLTEMFNPRHDHEGIEKVSARVSACNVWAPMNNFLWNGRIWCKEDIKTIDIG